MLAVVLAFILVLSSGYFMFPGINVQAKTGSNLSPGGKNFNSAISVKPGLNNGESYLKPKNVISVSNSLYVRKFVTYYDPTTVKAGEVFTYNIEYDYWPDPDPAIAIPKALDVVITDTLPAEVVFIAASGGGIYAGGIVTWEIGDLGLNDGGQVTLTVKVAENTGSVTITNHTIISASNVAPRIHSSKMLPKGV
jgi:hypothetical protein